MAAKKKEKQDPKLKLKAGEISCTYDSVSSLISSLIHQGLDVTDFDKVQLNVSYDDCYYESDRPSVVAEWQNIYYQ